MPIISRCVHIENAVAIRPAGSQYIDYATRSRMRFYDWLVSL